MSSISVTNWSTTTVGYVKSFINIDDAETRSPRALQFLVTCNGQRAAPTACWGQRTVIPTESVPGWCVVALFGLGAWAYAGLALGTGWMAARKPGASEHLGFLLLTGIGVLVVGLVPVIVGYRLAMKVERHYDPADPDEPRIKF